LLLLSFGAAFAACKGKEKGGEAETSAAVKDDTSAKAATDLLARRDALMKSRTQVKEEREHLEAERQKILDANGDTSEIDKKLEESKSQEDQLSTQETVLTDQMQAFLETAKDVTATGNAQQLVAARENGVATREKAMATREDRVAQREAQLAAREKELAEREKNTCGAGGGGTTTIIHEVANPKGEKYNKRDVEPLLKKARETMSKKGILGPDLPAQAAGLEKEATKAMADGDYGPAHYAAQSLNATVEAMKIDRSFISAKIGRLSKKMSGKKLDDAKQKEVEDLFSDATSKYGDGDYVGANKKLNQIYRAID
jgi:protein-disulfide isomerase